MTEEPTNQLEEFEEVEGKGKEKKKDCQMKEKKEGEEEKCSICQSKGKGKEFRESKCHHKFHDDCLTELLEQNSSITKFYRRSNNGKMYRETLGAFKCPNCRVKQLYYKKEIPSLINEAPKDPKTSEFWESEIKPLVRIKLPTTFIENKFQEIWITKPSQLINFREIKVSGYNSAMPEFTAPLAIIDHLFDPSVKRPLSFHLVHGGLISTDNCDCNVTARRHMTLDEFYQMIYHHFVGSCDHDHSDSD